MLYNLQESLYNLQIYIPEGLPAGLKTALFQPDVVINSGILIFTFSSESNIYTYTGMNLSNVHMFTESDYL